jgi:hypothetical protein
MNHNSLKSYENQRRLFEAEIEAYAKTKLILVRHHAMGERW